MRALPIFVVVLSIGCGGSGSKIYTEFDDTGAESEADSAAVEGDTEAPAADSASDEETAPGGDAVSPGDSASASETSPADAPASDGAPKVACDGPEDCATGVCCADVTMAAACKPTVNTSECRPSCLNFGPTPCPGTSKLRMCHAKADCTQPNFGKCCLFENGASSTELCVNDGMVSFAKSCK